MRILHVTGMRMLCTRLVSIWHTDTQARFRVWIHKIHRCMCWCPCHLSQVSSVCTGACVDVHVTCHRCHQSTRAQVLMSTSPVTGVISLHRCVCWCPCHLSQVSSVCTGALSQVSSVCTGASVDVHVTCHRCHQSTQAQVSMSTSQLSSCECCIFTKSNI